MDEVNPNNQPQRRRVLRARDVIPPFEKGVPPADEGQTKADSPSRWGSPTKEPLPVPVLEAAMNPRREDIESFSTPTPTRTGEAAEAVSGDRPEVPIYDLAENILAEQRRAAGRRRRAPGRGQEQPLVSPKGTGVRLFVPEPASQDLLELQQIVAQIVAQDIERLCKRPARPPFAVSA